MLPPWHRRAPALLAPLLLLLGCAGELENPERFSAPSTSGCTLDIDVETDIFGTTDPAMGGRCATAGCHVAAGGEAAPAASLDLVSPGVEARLVGIPAMCTGLLIDPASVDDSVLIRKLEPTPSCGARMPFGGMLSDAEIQCMREWAEMAAAAGGTDAGAGDVDAGAGDLDAGDADGGT